MDLQAFIAALKDYIARQELSSPDDESLLEMLFNVYTEFNGFDNDTIREDFNAPLRRHERQNSAGNGSNHLSRLHPLP